MNKPIDAIGGPGVRRGAAVLLEVLRSEGVEYIFGNPGTTELPLIDAMLETPDIATSLRCRRRAPWRWPMGTRRRHASRGS